MINRVVLNETSYFGRGSRRKIVDEIKSRGYEKILVVSDINFQTPLIILPMTLQNIVQKKLLRLVC